MVNKNTWQPDLDLLLINVPFVGIRWLWPLFSISQLCGWNTVTSSSDCNDTWGVMIRYVSITACGFARIFLEVNIVKEGVEPLVALWYYCWHINSVHSEGQLIFASRHALCHLPSSAQRAAGGGENPIKIALKPDVKQYSEKEAPRKFLDCVGDEYSSSIESFMSGGRKRDRKFILNP